MLFDWLRKLFSIYWQFKIYLFFKLYGAYGVSGCIEEIPFPYRTAMLRKYGATIGENCVIEKGLVLHRPDKEKPFKNLVVADGVYLGHNVIIDLTSNVTIGKNTSIGANVQLWTHTGDMTYSRDDYHEKVEPVKIGEAVIIYSGAVINQGVSIGDYARIGAGSLVLNNVKSKMFCAGTPTKEIKKIDI